MKSHHLLKSSLVLAAGLFLSTAASQAALAYHVTISTASLGILPNVANGLFSLDFQLNSGDTLGNNTATINNFTFNGGSAFGSATLFGGATGDLGSSISITDSEAFNEIYQAFNAGGAIEFDLFLTQNVDTGLTPDSFSISILDNNLENIETTGFANTILSLNLDSPTAGNSFGDLNFASGTGSYSAVALTIPEPSAALLGAIACGLGVLRRRRSA
jgi:hypothetical protein